MGLQNRVLGPYKKRPHKGHMVLARAAARILYRLLQGVKGLEFNSSLGG